MVFAERLVSAQLLCLSLWLPPQLTATHQALLRKLTVAVLSYHVWDYNESCMGRCR